MAFNIIDKNSGYIISRGWSTKQEAQKRAAEIRADMRSYSKSERYPVGVVRSNPRRKKGRKGMAKKRNPATTVRGWVKAKAVKIVRNKAGRAVSVKIKT